MTKKAILIRKLRRAFANKDNIQYSLYKGYPANTYFGYASFDEFKTFSIRQFLSFYGKGLKHLKFHTL